MVRSEQDLTEEEVAESMRWHSMECDELMSHVGKLIDRYFIGEKHGLSEVEWEDILDWCLDLESADE